MLTGSRPGSVRAAWFARFASPLFLGIQMLILLDMTQAWNDSWVEKGDDDERYLYGLLGTTGALGLCCTPWLVLLFFGTLDVICCGLMGLLLSLAHLSPAPLEVCPNMLGRCIQLKLRANEGEASSPGLTHSPEPGAGAAGDGSESLTLKTFSVWLSQCCASAVASPSLGFCTTGLHPQAMTAPSTLRL
jgi:hypothetical protein